MTRREILKYTALATGAAVSAPLMGAILTGCKPEISDAESNNGLHFFNTKEAELLKDLVDTILPKTDSPSASEVGVDLTIDSMLGTVYHERDQNEFRDKFGNIIKVLKREADNGEFGKLDQNKKIEVLKKIELSEEDSMAEARRGLIDLKQQTVACYLLTSEIATNYLNYLPVPGEYESCISLAEVGGKAWAL